MEKPTEYKRPRLGRTPGIRELTCQDCVCDLNDENWSKSNKEYGRYICKKCWNTRQKKYNKLSPEHKNQKKIEREAKWDDNRRKLEADKRYGRWLKRTYGITYEDYNQMLALQEHSCKICHSKDAGGRGRFHVDHCHTKGHIRGLLCAMCNLLLGKAKDNPSILLSAVKYLEDNKGEEK